jgi:hypothetical protein
MATPTQWSSRRIIAAHAVGFALLMSAWRVLIRPIVRAGFDVGQVDWAGVAKAAPRELLVAALMGLIFGLGMRWLEGRFRRGGTSE